MLEYLRRLFGKLSGRKESDRRLRFSEERFRLMVESVKDYAIFMLDPRGHVLTWNSGAERIKGYLPEEIIGQHFSRFYPEEAVRRGWPDEELRRASVDGRIEDEGWRLRKDGSRFWASVVITALRDETGTLQGFGKVTRDLTERRQAEENARHLLQEEAARKAAEDRSQLAAIVESSEDAIVSSDLNGIVTSWNKGAERLFGYSAAEAIGQPLTKLSPDEHAHEIHDMLGRIEQGEFVDHFEAQRQRKDGSCVDVSLTVSPVRDADGQVVGISKIARDISERKRMELELRAADRRKTEFLAVLAHELRNPLAAIRNGLQVMSLASHDRQATTQSRTLMERQLNHLVRLVDDLLDVNRINQGKVQLHKQRITLATVVAHTLELCEQVIKLNGHPFTVTVPDEPIYVDADKTRLAQALCNLLSNACKYSDNGCRIWLTAQRMGHEAIISVKDTGVGIAADMLSRVFDIFTQSDHSHEKCDCGLGVGLTIVKRLVEMHGGTVAAQSDGPGLGSEFIIRLPLALTVAEEHADELESRSLTSPSARRRILVVDDNVDAASSLAMMLRFTGNEVQLAHDGVEAIGAAAVFRPDMILLDIGMPKLNGYDTCRRMRQQSWGRQLVIIALTGWGQDEDRRRAVEAGFDSHLVKPVDPVNLERLLDQMIVQTA